MTPGDADPSRLRSYDAIVQTAIFIAIVALILVAVALSGRSRSVPYRLVEPSPEGLVPIDDETGAQDETQTIPWSDVYRVSLIMKRRFVGPPTYAFETRSEFGGTRYIKGGPGTGSDQLLAESHQLPGFDHQILVATLSRNESADVVLFSR